MYFRFCDRRRFHNYNEAHRRESKTHTPTFLLVRQVRHRERSLSPRTVFFDKTTAGVCHVRFTNANSAPGGRQPSGFYFAPGREAKYCKQRVRGAKSLSVCLSVCSSV